ncbi:M48 family metallopeptidase [Thiorhodococcus mannitoliphagus]|uniref:M48 family metallopeptidase n=1 Tax=Thiorhodococcus mannitoliphagus TaxID=329406 RepID=A0A6P1E0F4_9GAMM|nr:M48 family metallopeptidase [Thiorhodococcus mannitoliphagus]NEX21922.1 M48 family metallopeptidase [Thiorhodococcus mannitoliphagus]
MNFFEHQARARRRTWGLVGLFALALICIVMLVDVVALMFFGTYQGMANVSRLPDFAVSGAIPGLYDTYVAPNLGLLFWVSLLTAGGIGLTSQIRILTLRGGGGSVARGLGGTLVTPDTTDPLRRRLRNVVEEIAIASGVPVPEIYVLDREPSINAFAAGWTPSDAAVAVTQGALEALTRDELQGVVAHEFGHILNGDMRLNIRLMGLLFGILILALIGRFLIGSGRHSTSRNDRGVLSIGLALVAVGYVGLFFGRLIKASVSRQREYLADASAVQFTRQPDGIAGALKKIGASGFGSALQADPEEVSHMLFAKGLSRQLFATHPPLIDRIRAIQPRFDPRELTDVAARMRRESQTRMTSAELAREQRGTTAPTRSGGFTFDADKLIDTIGQPGLGQVMAAGLLAAAIPRTLERAAHSQEWVLAVVCYLLIHADAEVRERQLLMVSEALGQEVERQLELLLKETPEIDPELRIPLLEIAFPTLRRRPERDLTALRALVDRLIQADGRMAFFEYAIAKLLGRQVEDVLNPSRGDPGGRGKLSQSTREVFDLLTILAHHGQADATSAHAALIAGLSRLGVKPQAINAIKEDWLDADWLERAWSTRLDAALAKLDGVRLADKQRLLGAMAATVMADGQVAAVELELLRAICAALRMPLPVFEQAAAKP